MKKCFLLLAVSLIALVAAAQYDRFDAANAERITILTVFEPDEQGFLKSEFFGKITEIDSVERVYAFDKKARMAYVQTPRGNYAVLVKDDVAKQLKKDKSVNKLKGKDLDAAIEICDLTLQTRADKYNAQHEEYLQLLRERERKERMEDSIREQRRQDSLLRVKEAERQLQEQKKLEEYRAEHTWRIMPMDGQRLSCLMPECSHTFRGEDLICFGIVGDTIYYAEHEDVALDVAALRLHCAKYTPNEKRDSKMLYHIRAFADSLYSQSWLSPDFVNMANIQGSEEALAELKKKAPYGFFQDWRWNDDYGTLAFSCEYVNLNKKTIKYIDINWALTNDVDDVRSTGHLKGTGPVKYLDSGSWEWDNTMYFVAGDVTRMVLTKVVLTYMDGTKKVLNRKDIKFD